MSTISNSHTSNLHNPSMFSLSLKVLDFPNDQTQINPATKELWYFNKNKLNKHRPVCLPEAGTGRQESTTSVYTFNKKLPGRLIYFTRTGNILCSLEKGGEVYFSQNNGQSFTPVLTLSETNSWAMNWACEEIDLSAPASGRQAGNIILLGEYHLNFDNRANIYISENDGQSFKHLMTIPNKRHIHFIKKDPYSEYIYITVGDDTKDVYRMSIKTLKPELLFKNNHIMSVGFHPEYIAFGSDKEYQNFITTIDRPVCLPEAGTGREGKTTTFDLTPPRDCMVYDFANIGKTMISTNRLAGNSHTLPHSYYCLWVVKQQKAIANIESFYLSNVIDKTCYTGRTALTLQIRG